MTRQRLCALVAAQVVLGLLCGCSSSTFPNSAHATFGGVIKGGEQPITGAAIQLWAVNTATNGGTSMALISATVTSSDGSGNATNANANAGNAHNSLPAGFFTITGDYTCPSASAQMYLTASGGNPGLVAGTNNGTIREMLALGSCGQLTPTTNLVMNEVTTVGSVAALYPYMTGYNAIGSTPAAAAYLGEEFSVATEYMNQTTGQAPGPNLPGGYYASSTELNTLADVVFTCINSMGATPNDGSSCGSLLQAAKPSGGSAPTDTVALVLDVLKNPTNNVGGIFAYLSTTPPFAPFDATAPTDWTLPILPLPTTPNALPVAATYAGAQAVTLTAPQTAGVTIYYTTNGSTPTTGSSVYSGPISVSASETVKAIAVSRAGASAVGTYSYTIAGAPAAPVISLAAGTYGSPQIFTVTSPTPDAAVYVTTDGTTPTSASTLVTSSLQLEQTETVKAVAIAGGVSSSVTSAGYTYTPTSGTINTLAGLSTNTTGDGIGALVTELYNPSSIALAANGDLYISDTNNQRIRKVSAATGVMTTVAGTGLGAYLAAQDGGPATSAYLNNPAGIALDSSGNLYIADSNNHRIRMVSATTGIITTVAGTGTAGYVASQDGGLATNAELQQPEAVTVDAAGNIYIADTYNFRIRKVTASTGIITTVAGNGTYGYVAGQDGGLATSAEISTPFGVAVDAAGNIYIDDANNARIRKVTVATGVITTIAGTGTAGYVAAQDGGPATSAEIAPQGIAVDLSGNIYIPDTSNERVRKISAATGNITTLAGNGTSGYSGDGGPATSAQMFSPTGVAVDVNGNVFIADAVNNRIREVTASSGDISTYAGGGPFGSGTGGYGPLQYAGPGAQAFLGSPSAVTTDLSGNLIFADTTHHQVRKLNVSTGVVTTLAGTGVAGYSGDSGLATAAQLNNPHGVAVDSSGNIYIGDAGNQRVRKITVSTGNISTIAGTGTGGYVASQDNGPATSAELYSPEGLAFDGAGNLYIADRNNHRIRKINPSGTITTVAGTGTGGYVATQDGGPATSAELYYPSAVALDSSNNLYIADTNNHRIRKVAASNSTISTVAGVGTSGYSGDNGLATSAKLNSPGGVIVDSSGNIYIGDSNNSRVRKVTASTTDITTIAGTATAGFTGDGGAANAAEVRTPGGLVLDASGNLYFCDTGNNRIRVIYP